MRATGESTRLMGPRERIHLKFANLRDRNRKTRPMPHSGGCRLRMEKNPLFQKKKNRLTRQITRTTRQPPLLPEEVKHTGPTDILGTYNMVKQ